MIDEEEMIVVLLGLDQSWHPLQLHHAVDTDNRIDLVYTIFYICLTKEKLHLGDNGAKFEREQGCGDKND